MGIGLLLRFRSKSPRGENIMVEKLSEPREAEFAYILRREVEQQLEMEKLVEKCAISLGQTIIFLFDRIGALTKI